ncbi:lateral organ boundaries domain-containing protein [Cynara cardunculus var. scolymus]|uniref:Lateral organ boundaries domain-containing protein n=1 Tax=Cynara cardunculus var. scolymus TaxID=59895 RepID=A0A124SC54_CYNCS|nr:lateral organ boundaries domain-containing protein [Cynara cardunculus var. scolymus]
MNSTRCAVCKYFRRRCPSDCVFAPYFPPDNPQRFTCLHRIYGASNIGIADAPTSGRSGFVVLRGQMENTRAGLRVCRNNIVTASTDTYSSKPTSKSSSGNCFSSCVVVAKTMRSSGEFMARQNSIDNGLDDQSNPWFY